MHGVGFQRIHSSSWKFLEGPKTVELWLSNFIISIGENVPEKCVCGNRAISSAAVKEATGNLIAQN